MRIKRPKITLENIQIKSIEKAKLLAEALNTIEVECGIHEVEIEIRDIFLCPWIDLKELRDTPMQELLSGILEQLRGKQ